MGLDLDALRRDAEAFLEALNREFYETGAGLKSESAVAAIYQRYSHLAEEGLVTEVRAARDAARGEERRRLDYLLDLVGGLYMGAATAAVEDRLTNATIAATVAVDGESLPYRSVPIRLGNEPDRGRRRAIAGAAEAVTAGTLNPLMAESWLETYAGAARLGYPDYVRCCEDLGTLDLDPLAPALEPILVETAEPYAARLAEALRTGLDIRLDEAERFDIPRFFRASAFDAWFPAERAVPALRETLAGLGFRLEEQPNVGLDIEARDRKSPRAFCAPIRVPDEVMLVITPHGGYDDYHSLFHEAGHAEHFGGTARELPFEYRHLGDNSVTETYAMLLQYLVNDSHWTRVYLGFDDPAFARHTALQKTYFLRRYVAKLLYELELHRVPAARAAGMLGKAPGEPAGARSCAEALLPAGWASPAGGAAFPDADRCAARYAQRLSDATLFRYRPAQFLEDVDPGFYVARYLRAWVAEAQLRNRLRERFGAEWFRDRRAGVILRDLWAQGQRPRAEEVLAAVGAGALDPAPLIAELVEGLSVSP